LRCGALANARVDKKSDEHNVKANADEADSEELEQ
jgi:hypothetical protein